MNETVLTTPLHLLPLPSIDPKTKRHKRLFRFSDKVSPKVSWCLRHLCSKDEPFDHYKLKRKPIISTKRHTWNTGHDCVDWVQVSEHDWLNIENLSVELKSGQLFSIRGALGACHDTPVNKHDVDYLITRLRLNRHCTSDELSVDNFMYHHSGSVVKHHMRHGDIVFPIYPRDLERGLLDKCPSIVVEDHIRCWNAVNENLVGLSLTSPMFSDGNSDYVPWKMVSTWFCCSKNSYIHSNSRDVYNDNYSGFVYLPEVFRMLHRRAQRELSMCTSCKDHVYSMKSCEISFTFCQAECYMSTRCVPLPDPLSPIIVQDDKYVKVPRTNAALRHLLMSSCSLKCLTLFSNSYSPKRVRSTHFPLCEYELAGDDWESKFFFNFNLRVRNLNYGFKECRLVHDKTVFSKGIKNLLFYL